MAFISPAMTSFHWLPFTSADGPFNMAADDVLLHAASEGIASFRFYGWTHATLSLGYFQPACLRSAHPEIAAVPWVRRSSGGKALIHHHELTYALALPTGFDRDWMPRMHHTSYCRRGRLGLAGQVDVVQAPSSGRACGTVLPSCGTALPSRPPNQTAQESRPTNAASVGNAGVEAFLCFHYQTPGDLTCAGHKIVGASTKKKSLPPATWRDLVGSKRPRIASRASRN